MPLLQRLLGRSPAPEPPQPLQTTLLAGTGPSDYTTTRAAAPYVSPYGQWAPNRADVIGDDGPFYDDRAPTDRPASEWYGDRPGNDPFAKNRESERRRHLRTTLDEEQQRVTTPVVHATTENPYRHHDVPTPPSYSPSTWRFLAHAYGIGRSSRHLNGTHFSMADEHRTYELGGMQAQRRFRNTYRMEPPPRDARNMDVPSPVMPDAPVVQYQSPDLPSAPSRGGSWRLT